MFRKLFVSVLVVSSSFILAIGQSPEAGKEKEKAAQAFTFTFEGDDGYLGVQTTEVSKENFGKFGLREVQGVAVEKVLENSPAAKAGLKAGDIIVEADGKAVKGDFDLIRAINRKKDGDIQITFVRDRSRQTVSVTPEGSKDSGFVFQTDEDDAPAQLTLRRTMTLAKPVMPLTLLFPGRVL